MNSTSENFGVFLIRSGVHKSHVVSSPVNSTSENDSMGFAVDPGKVQKPRTSVDSAFIKTETNKSSYSIRCTRENIRTDSTSERMQIKLEVDTDPQDGFETEARSFCSRLPLVASIKFGNLAARALKAPKIDVMTIMEIRETQISHE